MHAVIGRGSIGKIVYPELMCRMSTFVSKVAEKSEVVDEYERGQQIIAIVEDPLQEKYLFGVYGLKVKPLLSLSTVVTRQQKRKWTMLVDGSPDLKEIDPGNYHMQMEKADGDMHSLLMQCRTGFLKATLVALRNSLHGLTKMHAGGYYHFDVKPANILYFGPRKSPITTKMGDFGLARQIDEDNFYTAASLSIPWYNFPPWASFIALKLRGADDLLLNSKAKDIRAFFEQPDHQRFDCVECELYSHMQIDLQPFMLQPKLLFDAVDIYGIAMCLDFVFPIAPMRVQSHIRHFCTDAAMCNLPDKDVLQRWDAMLAAF